MKTKILIALCGLFMLSSLVSNAHSNISCDGSGGCWYTEYYYDSWGNPVFTKHEYIGYGCVGGWCTEIDRVVPSGPPSNPELSSDQYSSLAALVESDLTPLSASESAAMAALMADNPDSKSWANPLVLTADAYDCIYGGTTYYDIFYVYASTDVATGAKMLNLYSDADKICNVTYTDIMGNAAGSENVSVSRGSNNIALTVPPSLPSGYYTVKVTSSDSEVNTSLSM